MSGLVAGALVISSLAPRALAQTAGDQPEKLRDDIAAKREEAARIAGEVEELGARASIAVEEYRQSQARLDEADSALFEARRRVEELRRRYEDTRDDAGERIVAMYTGEAAPDPLALMEAVYFDARNAREVGARRHYAGIVAGRDRSILDRLRSERETLGDEEERLEVRREEVAVQADALAARRAEVEAATAQRRAALDAAQGELAGLVAEEQRRRQAEEEARAREVARRRAAEDARRRAAATTTSTVTVAPPGGPPVPTTLAVPVPPAPAAPVAPAGDVPPVHPRAGEAVQAAMGKIGTPYRWGANGPDAYDCSGLTTYAWGSVGVRLPRSSWMQQEALPPVPFDALQPGDLLFFGSPVHHVGIYIGDGKMVNAPYTGTEVRVDSVYRRDYAGAGRPG